MKRLYWIILCGAIAAAPLALAPKANMDLTTSPTADSLGRSVTFYASFDEAPQGDWGGGDLSLWTRSDHPSEKGQYVLTRGYDPKAFHVLPGAGVQGGALACTALLPRNGMLFFPAEGKLAFRRGGWGGAISLWIHPRPDTPFCDFVYITQKRWNDGGIWFDYNHDKAGDLRMGTFAAVDEGQTPFTEKDPAAPLVRVDKDALQPGAWNHVVLTWSNFDTGRRDGNSTLYINGKLAGEVRDANLAMKWDLAQTRVYLAFQFLGLLDEFALFGRGLSAEDVDLLYRRPELVAALKKKGP